MDRIMAAMYLRFSNEDRDKEKGEESNSISAQRALLARYIEELHMIVVKDFSGLDERQSEGSGFLSLVHIFPFLYVPVLLPSS